MPLSPLPSPAPFPRLGIETAGIPHDQRHGLIRLARGTLSVNDGALEFSASGDGDLPAGRYAIPHQAISAVLLGPGSSVTHDALRLLGTAGTALLVTGDDGVRLYNPAVPPGRPSALARRQARAWADQRQRRQVVRRLYARLLRREVPRAGLDALRGLEGAFFRQCYARLADEHGIHWHGRDACRGKPEAADPPNQAINHGSSAVRAAAAIAVQAVAAIPQLGFIHEDDSSSFVLDIADQFRESVIIPAAFSAVRHVQDKGGTLEAMVRREVARRLRREGVIGQMIDVIHATLGEGEC